jgi:tetratricopeptide (TPR) repeat protein
LKTLTVGFLLVELQLSAISFAQGNPKAAALFMQAQQENAKIASRQAALAHIGQALVLEPKNSLFWQEKASILINMEEQEQALPCINKAVELDPKSASLWETKASALSGLRKNLEALQAISEAVRLDPSKDYRMTKIDILMHLFRFDQAEKELDDGLKANPLNPLFRDRRAAVATHTKHWDKVIEDRTFLLKQVGPKSYAYCGDLDSRAAAYVNTKQFDKAIADYKTALKSSPSRRQSHTGLLNVYVLNGNTKAAQAERSALSSLDEDFQPFK